MGTIFLNLVLKNYSNLFKIDTLVAFSKTCFYNNTSVLSTTSQALKLFIKYVDSKDVIV